MPAALLPADPILVALDVGSSSVRSLAFDRKGGPLDVVVQRPYEPTTTPYGGVERQALRDPRYRPCVHGDMGGERSAGNGDNGIAGT